MKVDKSKWEKKTLGEVGKIISGSTPKTNNPLNWINGTHNWVTPAELKGEKYYGSTLKKITDVAIKSTNLTLMPIGTVLLSSRAPIGKVAITTEPMYCNQGFKNIECNPSIIYNEFLYFYLKYNNDELNRRGNGVTFKEISKKIVDNFPVVVPNLEEQQSIASELDAIQTMIDGYNAQLDDLDELAKSIFLDMFGNVVTNERGWKYLKFGTLTNSINYGTSLPAVNGGKYKYLRMGNITDNGSLDFRDLKYIDIPDNDIEKYIVRKGDILFNRTNSREKVGKTACFLETEEMVIAGYIIRVRLDESKALPLYIAQAFNCHQMKDKLRNIARGSVGQANINSKELSNILISVPPLALQQQFAAKIETIESQKEKYKAQLADAEQLMAERMQYYFS